MTPKANQRLQASHPIQQTNARSEPLCSSNPESIASQTMTHITHETDPVSVGIREWQKVKLAAEEAVARCKKAEDENAFLVAYYLRGNRPVRQVDPGAAAR